MLPSLPRLPCDIGQMFSRSLDSMARPEGFEPPTLRSEVSVDPARHKNDRESALLFAVEAGKPSQPPEPAGA